MNKQADPICEECDEPMHRYGPALDTGKMGWSCDSCGWSWDDEPSVNKPKPPRGMNGQQLYEWLAAIPKADRANCRITLEANGHQPLITAKVYDEDRDGRVDRIYLIHK